MTTAVSASTTDNKHVRRSASDWRALMREFSQCGETRAQFCERNGLTLSTFAWWRSHLRRESAAVLNTTPTPTGAFARNPDTDGDGVSDNVEIAKGTDPLNSKNYPGDGDLNQDGLIDAGDLLLETQIVLGLRVPTAAQLTHGDMNQDGLITTPDLLKLQRKALGIIALNALRAMPGYEPMLAVMNSAEQHIQTATNKIETTTRHLLASILTEANATPATGKLYYVHIDQLGTPQVLTDETGAVVWRATYDPFGKATITAGSTVEMNVRMPGQYFDQETGLHYNYFRYYDPRTGRYPEADPIGLAAGSNPYVYANLNPLRFSDPLGLCPPGDVMCGIAQRQAGIPQDRPETPSSSTLSPCEMQWLNNNYGMFGGFVTDTFNLQQYLPSAPNATQNRITAGEIGTEKYAATKGVGIVGQRYSITWATVWGTVSSATVEVAGAGFTTFATTAKSLARKNCSCEAK